MSEIVVTGRVVFDPVDVTRKHVRQAAWKSVAVLQLAGEDHAYYAWLVRRRYGVLLNPPLRGSHVTFVNDRTDQIRLGSWKWATDTYKTATVSLSTDVRTNGSHWWLKVTDPGELPEIRRSLGLQPDPYFTMHMTLGLVNPRSAEHSEHLCGMLSRGLTR